MNGFVSEDDEFNDIGKFDGVQLMDYTTLGEIPEDHLDNLKLTRGLHAFKSKFKTQQIFSKPVTQFDASECKNKNWLFSITFN